MYEFLQSGVRLLRTGWFFAFILLALPNCALDTTGNCFEKNCDPCTGPECEDPDPPCTGDECPPVDPPKEVFDPGTGVPSDAVMCEIPKPTAKVVCASPEEANDLTNISLAEAATALANGSNKSFALDFSQGAKDKCDGLPQKIEFYGVYPDGYTVCLDCETNPYASKAKACVAKCIDLVNNGAFIPDEGAVNYCEANAKTATNYDTKICYTGACTDGGTPKLPGGFFDPRRNQEPVKWVDPLHTDDNGGSNSLTMTSVSGGFYAGAASEQIIAKGDAWVEFEVNNNLMSHVLGLRESKDGLGDPCYEAINCQDGDGGITNIAVGLILFADSAVYALENGTTVPGALESYNPGERFRVKVVDNNDGTASISYAKMNGTCQPGTECAEVPLGDASIKLAYPIRVDTTLRDQGSTIANVTIVRIQ
jgi:hypothetical protein